MVAPGVPETLIPASASVNVLSVMVTEPRSAPGVKKTMPAPKPPPVVPGSRCMSSKLLPLMVSGPVSLPTSTPISTLLKVLPLTVPLTLLRLRISGTLLSSPGT